MLFSSTLAATAVLTLANAAVIGKRALSGEATVYGGNLAGGTCSFSTYTLPAGIFGTALSDSNWDNSANCGRCVSVTGPKGNTITAMVVDQCPGCGTNHLDLFPDAYAVLDPNPGIIQTTWDYVDCPITTPLQLHNKEGVSAFWFSMQVVNANKPVKSLEVSTDGGATWQVTTRQTYNFFENSAGFGTTTCDVKVTSNDGSVVTVKDVQIVAGASTTAGSNFGGAVAAAPVASSSASVGGVAPTSTTPASLATPSTTTSDATTAPVAPVAAEPAPTQAATSISTKKPTALTFTPKPTSVAEDDDACEL